MTILLTGITGLLGSEIKKLIPQSISPTHKELDINDKYCALEFIKKEKITEVIHTAAIASVARCDKDKQGAWQANVEGTRNLVDALKTHAEKGYFIYISTACVFRGDESMYTEESIPDPVNFYAMTKLVGETIVQSLSNHLIIRTNFVGKRKWPYRKAFTDRFGTYLFADDVALGIRELYASKLTGIVHLVGDRVFSMFDIAKMTTHEIEPMTLKDYSGPHVTVNMTLDSKRWKKYTISKVN